MSDKEVGVSRRPDAARPMFRSLFPMPPTLVLPPRERLAQRLDIKDQNAYPCAASIPIVDAGVTKDNVLWRRDSHGKHRCREPTTARRPAEAHTEGLPAAGGTAVRAAIPPEPTAFTRRTCTRRSACRAVSPTFPGCGSARAAVWADGLSRLSAPHTSSATLIPRMPSMPDAPGSGASISSTMK